MMQTLKKYLDAKWEISMKGHIVHHQLSLPLESNNLVPRLLSRALVEKAQEKQRGSILELSGFPVGGEVRLYKIYYITALRPIVLPQLSKYFFSHDLIHLPKHQEQGRSYFSHGYNTESLLKQLRQICVGGGKQLL